MPQSKPFLHKKHFFQLIILAPLAVLIVVFGVYGLTQVSAQSFEEQVTNPQGGSLGIGGIVPGEPPQQAPAINTPVDGQIITTSPIIVAGTCEPGLIVEIYKNDVFAGSTICEENGTFELEIALFIGENVLQARVRDLLGQRGPDSTTVTVIYDPQVAESDRQLGSPLLLTSNVSFRGVEPKSEIFFPLQLSGGSGPYAIGINWGDGNDDIISRSDTGNFDISHIYDRPGIYRIVARATDEGGQTAFLQLTAVVNGEVDGGPEEEEHPTRTITEYILWPLYVLLALIPLAYWLGMRHVRRRYES